MLDITPIHEVNQQYRDALAKIRAVVDIEPDERRKIADELYSMAADRQAQMVDAYVSDRDNRIAKLDAEIFHGGPEFKAAVAQHAGDDADGLRRLASIARRTDQPELYRAAYVLATELDDAPLVLDLKRGDPVLADLVDELDALNDEAKASQLHPMYRSVLAKPVDAPGGPTMADITPDRSDVLRAEDEARREREAEREGVARKYARSIAGRVRRQMGTDVSHDDASTNASARRLRGA